MSKYKTLIFDLDNTLINDSESKKYAFTKVLNELGILFNDAIFSKWEIFDTAHWNAWHSGKMVIPSSIKTIEDKKTYLRSVRFINFFKDLNLDFKKAISLNDLYCSMLGVNIVEIENARKLLEELYINYEIVIATNGPKEAAISKLEKANLKPYISKIICSEDIGFSKPMSEFFDFLYSKILNKDKTTMLLIGDSLTTDILGGMNNGIDTCWFNPNNTSLPKDYYPTMIISDLLQLLQKL